MKYIGNKNNKLPEWENFNIWFLCKRIINGMYIEGICKLA